MIKIAAVLMAAVIVLIAPVAALKAAVTFIMAAVDRNGSINSCCIMAAVTFIMAAVSIADNGSNFNGSSKCYNSS